MSVRIKFCGFTRAEDAALAATLGVDAIGVVHVPGSKRHVPLEAMPALRAAVPNHIDLVALFVNPDADTVHSVITALQPSLLQFHGYEADAFCAQFNLPFIKAMAMGAGAGDIGLRQKDYPSAQAFVLDGHAPGQLGGQGERFAWVNLPALDKPIYLAGGLHAGNVAEAIATVKPYAVDVSSGIEVVPGIKNEIKMRAFVDVARMSSLSNGLVTINILRNDAAIAAVEAINTLTFAYSNINISSIIQKHDLNNYLRDLITVKDIFLDATIQDNQIYYYAEVYTRKLCKADDYILNGVLKDPDYELFSTKLEEMIGKYNSIILESKIDI